LTVPLYHVVEPGIVALLIAGSAIWLARLATHHPSVRGALTNRAGGCSGCASGSDCASVRSPSGNATQ
jgi:hypothetical protein